LVLRLEIAQLNIERLKIDRLNVDFIVSTQRRTTQRRIWQNVERQTSNLTVPWFRPLGALELTTPDLTLLNLTRLLIYNAGVVKIYNAGVVKIYNAGVVNRSRRIVSRTPTFALLNFIKVFCLIFLLSKARRFL
jgi:hypothetical protein